MPGIKTAADRASAVTSHTESAAVAPAGPAAAQRDAASMRMLEVGRERFPAPDFEVTRDERGAVWIKRADGKRSVGLSPWQLRAHSAEELLQRAEEKLRIPPSAGAGA